MGVLVFYACVLGFAFKIQYCLVKITLYTQHQYENTVLELTLKTVTSTACWYLSKTKLEKTPIHVLHCCLFWVFPADCEEASTSDQQWAGHINWSYLLQRSAVDCLKSKSFKITILAFCWLNRKALNECKCTMSSITGYHLPLIFRKWTSA